MKVTSEMVNAVLSKPKYKTARRIAVENFTMSAPDEGYANGMNLAMDARMYKWNTATVNAIKEILRGAGKM